MEKKITITIAGEEFSGKLNQTSTADAIWEELPIEASPSFWGEEIYFGIPVNLEENENPTQELEVGDLAYWPEGNSFCIFYGPTPSSKGTEPRPASPVTLIGKLKGAFSPLRELDSWSTERIRIEKGG